MSEEGLQVGQVLGYSYRIIASGTPLDIGTAYQAFDMKQGKVVSLLLAPGFETDSEILARLDRSKRAVAALAKEALIPFEHVGLSEGRLYLVRGHAEGHSLTNHLARFRTLQSAKAADIAFHIADALAPVHEAGLVHGSLSSRCIIVAGDGRVAVTDTGLFPALRPASLTPNEAWGRYPYLAPEQAAGHEPEPASDVYGIGLLLHEMLTGQLPHEARDKSSLVSQLTRGEPLPPLALPAEVPAALEQILRRALAPEPLKRYRHAGQLANLLSLQVTPTPAAEHIGTRHSESASAWRLVVPPPPAPAHSETGVAEGQRPRHTRGRAYWLLIALIIAALLAMLALIPLWLSIRPRDANPTPTPGLLSYHAQLEYAKPNPIDPVSPGWQRATEWSYQRRTQPDLRSGHWDSASAQTTRSFSASIKRQGTPLHPV